MTDTLTAPAAPAVPIPDADADFTSRVTDNQPWKPLNSDGKVNSASYESLAACGMVEMALSLLAKDTDGLPDPAKVVLTARGLIGMADEIQFRVVGKVERASSGHTRARGLLRSTVELVPMPADGTEKSLMAEWRETVVSYAAGLFHGALVISDKGPQR